MNRKFFSFDLKTVKVSDWQLSVMSPCFIIFLFFILFYFVLLGEGN